MKKILLIITLLLPLVVCAQSPTYERYASQKDLAVAQVTGFALNDSVRVDVVLVVADNAAAWQRLMQEYGLRPGAASSSWLGQPSNPAKRTRWTGHPVVKVVASHDRRTLAFYHLDNNEQYEALLNYQMNALEGKDNTTNKKHKHTK